jgi:hypothetical protein
MDERPSYARASGAILRFEDPVETRTRRRKRSWQEAAALRRMALDERKSACVRPTGSSESSACSDERSHVRAALAEPTFVP